MEIVEVYLSLFRRVRRCPSKQPKKVFDETVHRFVRLVSLCSLDGIMVFEPQTSRVSQKEVHVSRASHILQRDYSHWLEQHRRANSEHPIALQGVE